MNYNVEHYTNKGMRGTVAIIEGGRKPEEVLHVGINGETTHYVPEKVGEPEVSEQSSLFRPFIDNPATDKRFMWR